VGKLVRTITINKEDQLDVGKEVDEQASTETCWCLAARMQGQSVFVIKLFPQRWYSDVHAVGNVTPVYNSCYGNQATVECDAVNNMADARAVNITWRVTRTKQQSLGSGCARSSGTINTKWLNSRAQAMLPCYISELQRVSQLVEFYLFQLMDDWQ
jgi:hypothetical protein